MLSNASLMRRHERSQIVLIERSAPKLVRPARYFNPLFTLQIALALLAANLPR